MHTKYTPYSITSNTVKLLKHIDKLKNLQAGVISPIMVHTMPTHRCQLNCLHCCFKNRSDIVMDINPDIYMTAVKQFKQLGVQAMELTGGGEPTLYPHIAKCLSYFLDELGMKVGIITNGLSIHNIVEFLSNISWIRISLNTLDYRPAASLHKAADIIQEHSNLSFCYIWNDLSDDNISKVAQFVNEHKIACRVAPDCIMETKFIKQQIVHIEKKLKHINSPYLFLSDFNTTLTRRNNNCYIHLIKPALYTDGWIYPCPSAELAIENNKQINTEARLCHGSEVLEFYTNKCPHTLKHDCSYCKYSKQQDLLEDLLTETEFNEFA